MQTYIDTFLENLIKGIPNLLTALLILVASIYFARILSRILKRVLETRDAPEGVTHLLAQLTYGAVVVFGWKRLGLVGRHVAGKWAYSTKR